MVVAAWLPMHSGGAVTLQDILKVGVGAYGDALKVQRDFGFAMEGVLDLSDYANARLSGNGVAQQKWSLAGGWQMAGNERSEGCMPPRQCRW